MPTMCWLCPETRLVSHETCPTFGWCTWLPLASLLDEWDAVTSSFVSDSDEYGTSFARDQHILLFVYYNAVLCEDGDVAIVASSANAHQ